MIKAGAISTQAEIASVVICMQGGIANVAIYTWLYIAYHGRNKHSGVHS